MTVLISLDFAVEKVDQEWFDDFYGESEGKILSSHESPNGWPNVSLEFKTKGDYYSFFEIWNGGLDLFEANALLEGYGEEL